MAGLGGAADGDRVDGGGVAVAVTVVLVPAAVARRPDEDGAFAVAPPGDPVFERPMRQSARSINSFPIVIWSPGTRIDVDMIWIEAQRSGLDSIADCKKYR